MKINIYEQTKRDSDFYPWFLRMTIEKVSEDHYDLIDWNTGEIDSFYAFEQAFELAMERYSVLDRENNEVRQVRIEVEQ